MRRGELGLTKPGRPRGSFLLLGPTGVGKTETVVVLTNQIFGAGQLLRFDMSEFQNQESLGLLLGARLGEVGYLGGVRERAAEGSLLFDEAEKAHPRVLDILLQLLDAARITVATGQTLDFSGFYIWLTSNISSAELMSLQHSNDTTLERHVLTRAQQTLRPEIFARVNEKLVFHRLSYEHQLEIAEKFLAREIEFLAARDHKLELDKSVLPFLVRNGCSARGARAACSPWTTLGIASPSFESGKGEIKMTLANILVGLNRAELACPQLRANFADRLPLCRAPGELNEQANPVCGWKVSLRADNSMIRSVRKSR